MKGKNKSALEGAVLVLNRYFQPVHVVGVRDAMRLLVSDKAQVVDMEYNCYNTAQWADFSSDKEGDVIRTPRLQFVAPDVVRLLEFDKRARYTINFTRENIFMRDNHQCQYCGKTLSRKEATIDHVIPRSRQGDFDLSPRQISTWDNVVACCSKCNSKKANKTPKEAKMKLLNQPKQPSWKGQVRGLHEKNMKPIWKIYLETMKG